MTHTTSHIRKPFNIGDLRLPNRLVQAPLAGISSRAFRLQARRHGAGLLMTEMVSSYGVRYRNRRTLTMLELTAAEHPLAVQLFGSDADVMAEAAREAAAAGADIIDVNMGCPVRKVIKTGAGVALMSDENKAAGIVAAIVQSVDLPVTIKMRSGARHDVTAPSLAARLEAAGAAAIIIHPRTGGQMWKGKADHDLTRSLARSLQIPVIASGDIASFAAAAELLESGVSAVMPGRASLGDPWIFDDFLAGMEPQRRGLEEVIAEMERFFSDVVGEMGEERAVRYMRKFYGWYLRGFRPAAALRGELRQAQDFSEAVSLIRGGIRAEN